MKAPHTIRHTEVCGKFRSSKIEQVSAFELTKNKYISTWHGRLKYLNIIHYFIIPSPPPLLSKFTFFRMVHEYNMESVEYIPWREEVVRKTQDTFNISEIEAYKLVQEMEICCKKKDFVSLIFDH